MTCRSAMPDTFETPMRNNEEAEEAKAAETKSGAADEPVTAVLNRLREVAASHDAPDPAAGPASG